MNENKKSSQMTKMTWIVVAKVPQQKRDLFSRNKKGPQRGQKQKTFQKVRSRVDLNHQPFD